MDVSRRDFASILAGALAGLALPGSVRGLEGLGLGELGGDAPRVL